MARLSLSLDSARFLNFLHKSYYRAKIILKKTKKCKFNKINYQESQSKYASDRKPCKLNLIAWIYPE